MFCPLTETTGEILQTTLCYYLKLAHCKNVWKFQIIKYFQQINCLFFFFVLLTNYYLLITFF